MAAEGYVGEIAAIGGRVVVVVVVVVMVPAAIGDLANGTGDKAKATGDFTGDVHLTNGRWTTIATSV
jgi:hypothetical protein